MKPYQNTQRKKISVFFAFFIGLLVMIFIPAVLIWGFLPPIRTTEFLLNATLVSAVFSLIFFSLEKLNRYPGVQGLASNMTAIICWYAALLLFLMATRVYYSGIFLSYSAMIVVMYFYGLYFIRIRTENMRIAHPNYGHVSGLYRIKHVNWLKLEQPRLPDIKLDGIAADLNTTATKDWQQFYVDCAFKKIPVFNYKQLEESLTGRVKIDYLYENQLGTVLPSPVYQAAKRLLDISAVVVSLPLIALIVLVTMVAIKLESKGPIFFTQNRIGRGNIPFKIYKLRSMTTDSEKNGAQFATHNDSRVTKVGKFIRKSRIDELPQFWNVLKGDMSLIGPRPEQACFVENFTQKIPFYAYRHMVKPGISGWAQVMHGYAADEDETQVKIEYDFYYIKHFSLWLDILIVFKTIKTMLTGFGSR